MHCRVLWEIARSRATTLGRRRLLPEHWLNSLLDHHIMQLLLGVDHLRLTHYRLLNLLLLSSLHDVLLLEALLELLGPALHDILLLL